MPDPLPTAADASEVRCTLAALRFRAIASPSTENWLTSMDLPEKRFDDVLNWLFHSRWVVLSAEQLLHGIENLDFLPERAVVLTFDGASRTLLEGALPILRKYRFPAVTFVPTDFVGRTATFDGIDDPIEVCSWDELLQLDSNEISVQSTGAAHRRFYGLDPPQQEHEAASSRQAIEAHLGRPSELFAYPHGDSGDDPARAAGILGRAGYRAAFLLGGGVNPLPGTDPYGLVRIVAGPDTDLESVLGP